MNVDQHYINLDEINTLNKKFKVNKSTYNNKNKEYFHLIYNFKDFFINFKGTIYNIKLFPRNKIFIKIDKDTYNYYKELLLKMSTDLGITIKEYDSIYLNGDNYYLLGFIVGFKSNQHNIIYTNFKLLDNNKFKEINIKNNKLLHEEDYIESFNGIITLKIKNLCKDSHNGITYKLFNNIHQIVITNKIAKKKKNNNVDNILKLINK